MDLSKLEIFDNDVFRSLPLNKRIAVAFKYADEIGIFDNETFNNLQRESGEHEVFYNEEEQSLNFDDNEQTPQGQTRFEPIMVEDIDKKQAIKDKYLDQIVKPTKEELLEVSRVADTVFKMAGDIAGGISGNQQQIDRGYARDWIGRKIEQIDTDPSEQDLSFLDVEQTLPPTYEKFRNVRELDYRGNIDLDNRKMVPDGNGNYMTENSITIQDPDGSYVIIPTIVNGVKVDKKEAEDYYRMSGEHLGKYDNLEESEQAAQNIHLRQQEFYGEQEQYGQFSSQEYLENEAEISPIVPAGQPIPEQKKESDLGYKILQYYPFMALGYATGGVAGVKGAALDIGVQGLTSYLANKNRLGGEKEMAFDMTIDWVANLFGLGLAKLLKQGEIDKAANLVFNKNAKDLTKKEADILTDLQKGLKDVPDEGIEKITKGAKKHSTKATDDILNSPDAMIDATKADIEDLSPKNKRSEAAKSRISKKREEAEREFGADEDKIKEALAPKKSRAKKTDYSKLDDEDIAELDKEYLYGFGKGETASNRRKYRISEDQSGLSNKEESIRVIDTETEKPYVVRKDGLEGAETGAKYRDPNAPKKESRAPHSAYKFGHRIKKDGEEYELKGIGEGLHEFKKVKGKGSIIVKEEDIAGLSTKAAKTDTLKEVFYKNRRPKYRLMKVAAGDEYDSGSIASIAYANMKKGDSFNIGGKEYVIKSTSDKTVTMTIDGKGKRFTMYSDAETKLLRDLADGIDAERDYVKPILKNLDGTPATKSKPLTEIALRDPAVKYDKDGILMASDELSAPLGADGKPIFALGKGSFGGALGGGTANESAMYYEENVQGRKISNKEKWLRRFAAIGGGAYLGKKYGGKHGAKMFVGAKATGANIKKLDEAKKLYDELPTYKKNYPTDAIEETRKATGWFKDKDGEWRFELDDSGAKLSHVYLKDKSMISGMTDNDYHTYRLEHILDHPKLYKAYPQLKGYPLTFETLDDTTRGISYGGYMSVDPHKIAGDDDLLSIVHHEVQHEVQMIENFARGGDSSDATRAYLLSKVRRGIAELNIDENSRKFIINDIITVDKQIDIDKLKEVSVADRVGTPYHHFYKRGDWYKYSNAVYDQLGLPPKRAGYKRDEWVRNAAAIMVAKKTDELPVTHAAHLEQLKKERPSPHLKSLVAKLERVLNRKDKETGFFEKIQKKGKLEDVKYHIDNTYSNYKLYRSLLGETEARNTEARRLLNARQRKNTPIYSISGKSGTADVEYHDTISYRNSDNSISKSEDYRGSHTAPTKEGRNSGHDVRDIWGEDMYKEPKAYYWYGDLAKEYSDKKAVAIIKSMEGKPNKEIKIYRAVPKGVKTINDGDWVTPVKEYAQSHGYRHVGDDYEIIEKTVKAKDIHTDGNSIFEWGYSPAQGVKSEVSEKSKTIKKQFEGELPTYHSYFKEQGNLEAKLTYKRPLHLPNGDRISGFTDRFKTTAYGYDKNGEIFTIRKDILESDFKNKKGLFKAPEPTRDANFKKWFEGSKAVDRNGNPLVMYHGTNSDIKSFDKSKIRLNDYDVPYNGFWFTNEPMSASPAMRDPASIMPVYLNIKNPATRKEAIAVSEEARNMLEEATNNGTRDILEKKLAKEGVRQYSLGDLTRHLLQKKGYDGVYHQQPLNISMKDYEKAIKKDGVYWVNKSYYLKPDLENGGVDLFNRFDDHITGYYNVEDYLSQNQESVLVAFEPSQIKSVNNRGTFDGANPNILQSSKEVGGALVGGTVGGVDTDEQGNLVLNPAGALIGAAIGAGVTYGTAKGYDYAFRKQKVPKGKLAPETPIQKVQRIVQDKFNRVKQLQDVKAGKTIADDINIYQMESNMHGRAADRMDKATENILKPLERKIAYSKHSVEELDDYLWARHAPERNAKMFELNGIENGSGMSDEVAAEIMAKLDTQEMRQLASYVDNLNAATIKLIEREGLESPEYIEMLRNSYEHYVPLRRAVDKPFFRGTGKGFDIKGKEFKRAKGSDLPVESPFVHSVLQFQKTLVRAEKNKVGQSLLRFIKQNPDTNLYSVKGVKYIPQFDETGNIVRWNPRYQLSDNVMHVKVDGKVKEITFKDPALARAFKNMGSKEMGAFMKASHKTVRWIAGMATQYNPEFILSNFTRDLQTALLNVPEEIRPSRVQMITDVGSAINGIRKTLRGQDGGEWGALFKDMKANGGTTGWMELYSYGDLKAKVLRDIKLHTGKGVKAEAYKAFDTFLDEVSNVNTAVENGIRLAVYKQALAAGKTKAQAAYIAKELTVNFNKKGEMGTALNTAYLFYNASIQGTVRLTKALAKSKYAQAGAVGMASIGAMLDYYNNSVAPDHWRRMQDYKKDTNMIIMKEDGTYFSMPLPYGYNVFKTFGEMASEFYRGERRDMGSRALGAVVSGFSPLGVNDKDAVHTFTPTLAKLPYELATNQNFFGGQLRPEAKFKGQEKADSQFYYQGINPIAKNTALWLNQATGGNYYKSGYIDTSPENIEHAVEFFTSGLGKFITRSQTWAANKIAGQDTPWNKVPFARRVYGEPYERAASSAAYDTAKLATKELLTERERANLEIDIKDALKDKLIDEKQAMGLRRDVEKSQIKIKWANKFNIQGEPTPEQEYELEKMLFKGVYTNKKYKYNRATITTQAKKLAEKKRKLKRR